MNSLDAFIILNFQGAFMPNVFSQQKLTPLYILSTTFLRWLRDKKKSKQ